MQHGRRQRWPPGVGLFSQGGRSSRVIAIHSGRVRVDYTNAEGRSTLLAMRGHGDLIGEFSVLDSQAHSADVRTVEACEGTIFHAPRFMRTVQRLELDGTLLKYLIKKTRETTEFTIATRLPVKARLAALLTYIVDAGDETTGPSIPMTQRELADSIGMSLRSVAGTIADWKELGVVRTEGSGMVIAESDFLRRLARSD